MSDTNTEVEAGRFNWIVEALVENDSETGLYEVLYPTVVSEEWTTFPLDDQINLAESLNLAYEALGVLRQKFDATIYKGHESGRINTAVKPVRAKPDFQNGKPGKSAPSAMDVLKRKVSKR